MSDAASVGRQSIEAFNKGDWDRLRAVLTTDVDYRETGTGRHATGEEYVQLCQGCRDALPDAEGEITAAVQEGDLAALQNHWTGTHGGTLHGPGIELPTTGKPIEGDATMWVRTTNGQAQELRPSPGCADAAQAGRRAVGQAPARLNVGGPGTAPVGIAPPLA